MRLVFATLFLLVLLSEWGSHSIHYASSSSAAGAAGVAGFADEQSVSADENAHEDPCKTLAVCSEGSRKNHQQSNLNHDSSQHNGLIDHLSLVSTKIDVHDNPLIPLDNARRLFRPPDLPFHPPRTS